MGRTSDARQRLMDAASELIWEYSYGAVTIDAICERAGVKKGSFYYFFESKSDLSVAAVDAWWELRKKLIENLFQPEVPPLERIQKYFDYVAERQITAHATTGQVLGCPLFSLGSEICTQDERIRSRLHGIINATSAYFEEAIREAQLTGQIEGTNAEFKARAILTFYAGVLIRARIENNVEPMHTLRADTMELLGVQHVVMTS